MMSKEAAENVKLVYSRFIEAEDVGKTDWTDLDENLELMDFLSDEELVVECMVRMSEHSKGTLRCQVNHNPVECFAPQIGEAVTSILDLYEETEELHPKNRYILTFYLAFSELKLIFNGDARA